MSWLLEQAGNDYQKAIDISSAIFLTDELKFDNTYSWTRSKELFYSVKVLPPDTEALDVAVPDPPPDLPSSSWQEDCGSGANLRGIEPDLETGISNEAEEGAMGGGPVITESMQTI